MSKKFRRYKKDILVMMALLAIVGGIVSICIFSNRNKEKNEEAIMTTEETTAKVEIEKEEETIATEKIEDLQHQLETLKIENKKMQADLELAIEQLENSNQEYEAEIKELTDFIENLKEENKQNSSMAKRENIIIIPYNSEQRNYKIPEGYSVQDKTSLMKKENGYVWRQSYTGKDFETYCPESYAILYKKEIGKYLYIIFEGFGKPKS